MPYLFVPENQLPEGVGFSLYGPEHLIWLAVLALMCVWMILRYRKLDSPGRQRMARFFAYGLLTLEILRDLYLVAAGGWEWRYLPLHPCSFTMFFMVLWAWKPRAVWGQLMYGYGLIGAMMALLFCNWTSQPVWQFQSIYSFLFHGVLVGWILMILLAGDLRVQGKGIVPCVVFLAAAAPISMVINHLLPGCNFFFTNEGSEGSPLEILIKVFGKPWWLAAYAALVIVVLAAEFLPWMLSERRQKAVQ